MDSGKSKWQARRSGLTYVVARRLWEDAFGSAYEIHKYRNGVWCRFWTRKQAEARAAQLNGE